MCLATGVPRQRRAGRTALGGRGNTGRRAWDCRHGAFAHLAHAAHSPHPHASVHSRNAPFCKRSREHSLTLPQYQHHSIRSRTTPMVHPLPFRRRRPGGRRRGACPRSSRLGARWWSCVRTWLVVSRPGRAVLLRACQISSDGKFHGSGKIVYANGEVRVVSALELVRLWSRGESGGAAARRHTACASIASGAVLSSKSKSERERESERVRE